MAAKQPDRPHNEAPDAPPSEAAKVRDILEYRSGLDDTMPPTPLKQLLAAGGANVYVLSTDPALRETVQRAGGEQYPVFTVATWPELMDAVDSGKCGIALVDAELLGAKLDKRIAELERYAGRLVTLVAADRAAAQELIGYLSERKIHRLLIKPPALGITRLLLESAVSRCIQLRERPHDPTLDTGIRPARRSARGAGGTGVPAWVLATALVALLLGVVVVGGLSQWWRPGTASSSAPAADATQAAPLEVAPAPVAIGAAAPVATLEPVPDTPERFAEMLARAERAFNEGRVAAPPGDNALDYYRTILVADPAHAEAGERLGVVLEALFAQAERALLDNAPDVAAAALASVRNADPDSSRLAFLEAQLERARAEQTQVAAADGDAATEQQLAMTVEPRASVDDAQPSADDELASPATTEAAPPAVPAAVQPAQPSELDSLLAIAAARLTRDQLVEPAGDSALAYLERATQIDATDRRVLAARTQLGRALAAAALDAAEDGDRARAESLAATARGLNLPAESLAAADAAIASLRHAELAATVRERLASDALLAPAGDSALDHLNTLQAEGATLDELPTLWSALTSAFAAKAREAATRRDWSGAQTWLTALERTGRDVGAVEQLERQVATGRLQDQYLATAAPASELRLVSYPPAEYPREAQQRGIEGWVDLELVVDRNGNVRDAVVVDAQPARRFDEAALAAVARYRYEPFVRDGQVYERRLNLRIRFLLE
jgi:protein TonB